MPNFLINVTTRGAKKAASGMKKLSGSLMKLSKVAMVGAAGGALALGVAMKKATDAAAEQELQETKLTQALGKNADALIKQAGALQQTSRFGDEAIIQQQAYLASIGMSEKQIREMIPVTMDLAAATGMSLESAVKNTAKTLSGMTGELGESVSSLRDLTAEELKAGAGIDAMREMFKGAAQAEVKTFRGAMDQASNAVGDMMEALGDLALPLAAVGASMTKDFAEKVEAAFDFIGKIDIGASAKNIFANLSGLGTTIFEMWKAIWGLLPEVFRGAFGKILSIAKKILTGLIDGIVNIGSFIFEPIVMAGKIMGTKIGNFFIDAINKIKDLYNSMASFIGLTPLDITPRLSEEGLSMANTRMGDFMTEMATNNIETTGDLTTALGDIWSDYADSIVVLKKEKLTDKDGSPALPGLITPAMADEQIALQAILKKAGVKTAEELDAARKTEARNFVSNMQTMGQAYPKMEKAGKRAAQVQATVDAYAAATAAYKAMAGIYIVGPALGIAAAAAALGAGLANVRMIESAATGANFVTSGPQMMMVGDNPGGMEQVSVTPLSSPNTSGPQGGGAVTVNVSGNVMSQDYVEGELAEQIKNAIRRGNDFGT